MLAWGRPPNFGARGAGRDGGLSYRAGGTPTETPPPHGAEGGVTEGRVWGPGGAQLSRLGFPERQRHTRHSAADVGTACPGLSAWSVRTFVNCFLLSVSSATEWTWRSKSLPLVGPQFPVCTTKGLTKVTSCVLRNAVGTWHARRRWSPCTVVLPAPCRAGAHCRMGGPGAFMVMLPYVCPDAVGLPPLGIGCLRFWREGVEQTLGGPLTTSCTLEGRLKWIYLQRGPNIYRGSGGNLAGLGLYLEEQTVNDEAKLVLTHD